MTWKKILTNEDKPEYYKPVIIFANGQIHYKWNRLSDGEFEYYGSQETDTIIPGVEVSHWKELLDSPEIIIKYDNLNISRNVLIEKCNHNPYCDPKDLLNISIYRLKCEGKKSGLQHLEWNNLFDINSSVRGYNAKKGLLRDEKISDLELWHILSNRFLLIDRLNTIKDQKLYNQDELLLHVKDAYFQGYMNKEKNSIRESVYDYLEQIRKLINA